MAWVHAVKGWISPHRDGVRQYPNPWRKDRHAGTPIIFENLKSKTVIRIFSRTGELIRTLPEARSTAQWDLTTETGDNVGSGIYLFEMETEDGKRLTGDMVVHRPLLFGTLFKPTK